MPKAKLVLAFLLALGALLPVALQLLPLGQFPAWLGQELDRELNGQLRIGSYSWQWLPIPQLRLHQVSGSNEQFEFDCPQALLYPDWHALFDRQLRLGRILLIEPRLTLKLPRTPPTRNWQLPLLKVTIKNGQLRGPLPEAMAAYFAEPPQLLALNGQVTSGPQGIEFQLTASLPFCPRLALQGRYDLAASTYRLRINSPATNLAQLFKPIGNEKIHLAPRPLPLRAQLEGEESGRFKLTVNGPLPTLELADGTKIAAESFAGWELERSGEGLALTLKELALSDPPLILNGRIARLDPVTPEAPPLWDLNFSARELDLSAIRQKVLTLWGEEPVAREVGNIVRGGQASQARFSFRGYLPELAQLSRLEIAVEVSHSRIHIPGIDLDLDDASGPVSIIAGNLEGHGLSARINESQGRNGELFLHLPSDADGFRLALDLDAALPDLSKALNQVVSHPGFHRELQHFQDFTGRAQGRLVLGERLSQLKTYVSVLAMAGQGRYDRLPWPVTVTGGTLEIAPQRASWKNIQAELGPQIIEESSGAVSWSGPPEVTIAQLRADLDAGELYRLGGLQLDKQLFTLAGFLGPRLTELDGRLHLDQLKLNGPAREPENWHYRAEFQGQELRWQSPRLPEPALAEHLGGTLDQTRATLEGAFQFQEQPLTISGSYTHTRLQDWQGWTELSGTISPRLAATIREWELIPPQFFPAIPCTLEKLRLQPGVEPESPLQLNGRLRAGLGGPEEPWLEIGMDPKAQPRELELVFASGEERGELHLHHPAETPAQTTAAAQGTFSAATLNALFARSPILSGQASGEATLFLNENAPPRFTGALTVKELSWRQGPEELPLRINSLAASGGEGRIQLDELALSLGQEELTARGTVGITGTGVDLDLALDSPALATGSIKQFLPAIRQQLQKLGVEPEEEGKELYHHLGGTIQFNLGQLRHPRPEGKGAGEPAPPYLWTPFTGELKLLGDRQLALRLDQATFCGLNVSGNWYSRPELGRSNFTLTTAQEAPLFEETLPCLGVKQNLIAGEFDLKASLSGEPGNWQQGSLELHSPRGKIWRMELLSKILAVVNITELFSWEALPNLVARGLAYTGLTIKAHVQENKLLIDRGMLQGEGLNLSGQGEIDLEQLTSDLTIFIAPFKTIDSIVGKVPLLNRVVGGRKGAILTIPLAVQGALDDPEITILSPSAVGRSTLEWLKETLSLPFTLFSPTPEEIPSK